MSDYGWGPRDLSAPARAASPRIAAERGIVLEDATTGWVGEIVGLERTGSALIMVLEDRSGRRRSFPLGHGFLIDGSAVEMVAPAPSAPRTPARSASGSVKVAQQRARVARASRIWVEGKHDAELVEKVWGDDLRAEGIVVEPLGGIDDLDAAVREFEPGPQRRLGVLVDHLVPGSKEERIAQRVRGLPGAAGNVLIVGHPYVDVWQVIKPSVLGIKRWPEVPRGQDWKRGVLRGLGWPYEGEHDVARGWQRLLGQVRTYADLEPSLLGRVEEVIDFLTA